ncbi:hypothetical protein FOCC_FOCC009469 [Frankliniella occidentalis]|nr:hypothetical protein FOCC_FOCC009469 [Frankliniella occidentalis]
MASAKVPLLTDTDDTIGFGEEDNINSSSYRHPYVIFFHLLFRSVALITYLFGTFVSNSFIAIFVTLILLLSMDFWTVKNITGRLLVGLRWWNYVDDNGKSHWVYESRKLVTTIALLLHGANLYGYIKCRFGSEKSMSTNVTDFFRKQVIQNVANIMTKPTQPSANAASATGVV